MAYFDDVGPLTYIAGGGVSLLGLGMGRLEAKHAGHRRRGCRSQWLGRRPPVGNVAGQDDADRQRPLPPRVPRDDPQRQHPDGPVQPAGRDVPMKVTVILNQEGRVAGVAGEHLGAAPRRSSLGLARRRPGSTHGRARRAARPRSGAGVGAGRGRAIPRRADRARPPRATSRLALELGADRLVGAAVPLRLHAGAEQVFAGRRVKRAPCWGRSMSSRRRRLAWPFGACAAAWPHPARTRRRRASMTAAGRG